MNTPPASAAAVPSSVTPPDVPAGTLRPVVMSLGVARLSSRSPSPRCPRWPRRSRPRTRGEREVRPQPVERGDRRRDAAVREHLHRVPPPALHHLLACRGLGRRAPARERARCDEERDQQDRPRRAAHAEHHGADDDGCERAVDRERAGAERGGGDGGGEDEREGHGSVRITLPAAAPAARAARACAGCPARGPAAGRAWPRPRPRPRCRTP